MKIQNSLVKFALEPMSFTCVPLLINNLKSNFFIWWTRFEFNNNGIEISIIRVFQIKLRCHILGETWVEHVEFVPLDHLGRRVISVIMSLVVLVPLETGFY